MSFSHFPVFTFSCFACKSTKKLAYIQKKVYFCSDFKKSHKLLIENTYFEWLRAALWQQDAPLSQLSDAEMTRLITLSAAQSTATLVFPRLLASADLPATLRQEIKKTCLRTMQHQARLSHTLLTAWQALTRAGIQPMLLKGFGLAALYPESSYRQWADIDLYVGREAYHRAAAVMRDTFVGALRDDEEQENDKHYNLIADGVVIEVHRVTEVLPFSLEAWHYRRIEQAELNAGRTGHISLNGTEIQTPGADFNVLFVFMHSWEHMRGGTASVKQLCDLALLLHHHAAVLNRRLLRHRLAQLRLSGIWRLYMYLLVHYIGLPADEAPFYTPCCRMRAERLIHDMIEGKMKPVRLSHPAPTRRLARKLYTWRERMINLRRLARYCSLWAVHMAGVTCLHGIRRIFL